MQKAHSYSFDWIPDWDGLMEMPKHIGPWIRPYLELIVDSFFRFFRPQKERQPIWVTMIDNNGQPERLRVVPESCLYDFCLGKEVVRLTSFAPTVEVGQSATAAANWQ